MASLALTTGCPSSGPKTDPVGPGSGEQKMGELDKLMRTRMNASYSQLVFLVFHAEGELDFSTISAESAKLSEAIVRVLELQMPSMVKSDEGRSVYVDYNKTLKRDNDRFVEATAKKDSATMQTTLTKIGETCSACHHFFRISIKDAAE
jgi:cytochrome c556